LKVNLIFFEIYNNIPVLETKNLEKILKNVTNNVQKRQNQDVYQVPIEEVIVKKKKEFPSEE
jgi:hypothetical protein